MDSGSHAATGIMSISEREAGVLRDERAPASCSVGAVGVASPADAIWTGHNRPSAVPRRRVARCAGQPPPAPLFHRWFAPKNVRRADSEDRRNVGVSKKCLCFQEVVCVSLFYVIDTGSIGSHPGPNRDGGYLSTLRPCSDAGYADLPLALLGAPVSIETLVKLGSRSLAKQDRD